MRHFKRFLWLAAWSVWLWLGVGLHRELPRSPGPILQHLSPPADWYPLPRGSGLVVGRKQQNGDVLVWEALTGRLVHTIPCADRQATVSSQHGVLVASLEGESGKTYSALDFRSGSWTNLNVPAGRIFHIHPDEPWAAVSIDQGNSRHIVVVDLHSGAQVADWKAPTPPIDDPPEHVFAWYFLGGREVAIVLESGRAGSEAAGRRKRLERWTLNGGRLSSVPLEPLFEEFARDPAHGRMIATRELEGEFSYHVLDLLSGRSIFDGDLAGEVPLGKLSPSPPQLSASGRRLLTRRGELWNIDDARLIWSPQDSYESLATHVSSNTAFQVLEEWDKLAKRWPVLRSLWSRQTMTMAVRDFETGALRYRAWLPFMSLAFKSDEQRFGLAMLENEPGTNSYSFGTVDHPPRVNWLLLALCQTILALPILLLWSLLWYRRRRAARRQPA
jgi:hypothetical protein